jgi:hypothetical protein
MPLLTALAVLVMGFAPWTWLSGPTSIVPAPQLQVATAQVDTATTVDAAETQDAAPADAPAVAGTPDTRTAPSTTRELSRGDAPRSLAAPRAPPLGA